MHPNLLQAIARQREDDLRRAARQRGPAGRRGHLASWADRMVFLRDGPVTHQTAAPAGTRSLLGQVR